MKVDKKRSSCKCGSVEHRNTNHPECKLFTNKTRLKSSGCPSCHRNDHFRRTNRLCPNNPISQVIYQ